MTMITRATLLLGAIAFSCHAALADGDAARGEKKFGDCAACHSLEQGVNNVGPSLHGVFGRKAGELPDYRYSPALKRRASPGPRRQSRSSSPSR